MGEVSISEKDIVHALHSILLDQFPGASVYLEGTPEQDITLPAFTIGFGEPGSTVLEMRNRYRTRMNLKLFYREDVAQLQKIDSYLTMARALDDTLQLLCWSKGGQSCTLHTHGREWSIDQEQRALVFRFRVEFLMSRSTPPEPKMKAIESLRETIPEKGGTDG